MADSSTGPRKWPHYEMHLMTFATMDTNNACLLILCAFLILFAVLFVVFRAAEHYTWCVLTPLLEGFYAEENA